MKTTLLKVYLLLLMCSAFLIQGCEEKEEDIQPEVQTLAITDVLPNKATLNGNIAATGKYAILDHGFVYGSSTSLNETLGIKQSLGNDAKAGAFSSIITGLESLGYSSSSPTLYARAFIKTEKGTVFGQIISVKIPSPSVQSISPTTGKAGDRITITGNFYTNNPNDIWVTFGNATAKVVEASASAVVVEVPTGIYFNNYTGKNVMVTLKVGSKTFNVTPSFTVISSVNDFSPKSGPLGTNLTIKGDNLPVYTYNSSVKVLVGPLEVPATIYSVSEIRASIPLTLTTEKAAITVIIDGITTVLPGEFTVTPHTVTSISPASGLPGSTLYITGTNLPDNYYSGSSTIVKIGDTQATISSIYYGKIGVTVPQNLLPGSHDVTVTIGPYTAKAPQQYEVLAPTVTGFSPASGGMGKEVTIYGVFQPGKYYTVYFGSAAVQSSSATANSIKVIVPANAPEGPIQLGIQFGTQRIYTAEDFTVLESLITSFTPGSGAAGTPVTITFTNFIPGYYTAVRFGTVWAPVLGYTASTIRVAVPSGATGEVKISVAHNGKTITSTDSFTVTN